MRKLIFLAFSCFVINSVFSQTSIPKDLQIEKMLWEKKFFTNELKMDLPFSKGNYFFAVPTLSKDSNEGIPVTPVPRGL